MNTDGGFQASLYLQTPLKCYAWRGRVHDTALNPIATRLGFFLVTIHWPFQSSPQAVQRWKSTALGPSLVAAREGRGSVKAEKAYVPHKQKSRTRKGS